MRNAFHEILGQNGIYISIGVLGFISSLTTLFFDINQNISIKWLLFVTWLFFTIVIISFKVIHDLLKEKPSEIETKFIKFFEEKSVLLIKTNLDLNQSSLISL